MINSILLQTFTDFEFLILNDSPENEELERIVKSYNDPRIKYLKNETNIGITKSRNKLIDMAKGEYLAVVDHDDISTPKRLELESDFLDKNPHIGVVGGNMQELKDGKIISISKFPQNDHEIKLSLINEPYVCTPNHPTSMIRADILRTHNVKYNEKWTPAEDHALWLDLIEHTCFHNIPNIVLKYIWHGNNTTIKTRQKMLDLLPIMINEARQKYPLYYNEWKTNKKNEHLAVETTKIKLLGFIPFLKIRFRHKQKKIYLFNIIQLARINYDQKR